MMDLRRDTLARRDVTTSFRSRMPPKKKKAGSGGQKRTPRGDTVRGCLMTLGIDDPAGAFEGAENLEDEFKVVKRAWHKMCLATHPDKGGSEEEFRAVQAAFDVLKDKKTSGTIGTFASSSAQSSSTSTAFKHASDAAAKAHYPPAGYYEEMRENINVPVYRVELAKTDRSSCFTAGPPQKRASGAAGKCRFGLGELCHPVITHATAASNVAVIGDGAEGPAPKKKRGRPSKPKPDGPKLTGKAYVDWAVKIPVNSVRVGSVDPVAGTYGRWSHAECWRVPGKVHRGLPNPALEPDPVAFERALLAMNEVVFCGFEELSLEHRAIVVARVMDVSAWAASTSTARVAPVAEADVVAADEALDPRPTRARGRAKQTEADEEEPAKGAALTGKKRARATYAAAEKAGKSTTTGPGRVWSVEEVRVALEAAARARPEPEPEVGAVVKPVKGGVKTEIDWTAVHQEMREKVGAALRSVGAGAAAICSRISGKVEGKVKKEPVVKQEPGKTEIDWTAVHQEMREQIAAAPAPTERRPGKVKGKVKKEEPVAASAPPPPPPPSTAVAVVKPKKKKPSSKGFIVPRPNAGLAAANCLAGKTVVLTGVFPQLGGGQGLDLGKARARAMIESFGGRVTGSVSGRTDVLLVGKEPGMSKVTAARNQPGCMLVSLENLCELLNAGHVLPAKGTAAAEELTKATKITSFSAGYWYNGQALKATPAQLAYATGAHLNSGSAGKKKKPKELGYW